MARIGEMLGWGGNPLYKTLGDNRYALMQFGAGLASGSNFGEGLANGLSAMPRGALLDQQYAEQQKQEAEKQQSQNATIEWLKSQGYEDLAQMAQATGDVGAAWTEGLRRSQPQPLDPFTLGKGEIRYDGRGNVIAQGPEGGPDTLITNNIGGSDKFYDTMDAKLAEQTASAIESGYNAQSNNIRLQQLESLLGPNGAPQGAPGALVQVAGQFGLPVEGLDDVQAAQALINQMVPGQRPPGSGTMSDADLALFKSSLPQIINSPGGNQKIIQTMKAINEYTIAQAEIAQRVANREISPAEGRALQAQVPNPLAGFGMPAAAASGLPPGVTIREIP